MMKAVLFDLDGTISNSKEGITKCVQYALKHFGIEEPDLDKLEVFIGPPLVDSFMKYYNLTEEQAKEEVLEEVFRRWNHLEKNEICLIGDTLFDVNGAKCAGIPCVAVSYGFGDVEEMKNAGAVAIIDDLMELPRVLKGIEL